MEKLHETVLSRMDGSAAILAVKGNVARLQNFSAHFVYSH